MKHIVLLFLVFFNVIGYGQTPMLVEHTYGLNPGPDKNPMKGWNTGWWADDTLATVGFQYIGWNSFEPTDDNFNFEAIENIIDREGSRGKHLILRLFCDWWGTDQESAAGPSWLYSDYGVERLEQVNDNGSIKYLTDFNHPDFIDQAIQAIEALAQHYDNDPRIYAFQLGVLGYWGEWHTASFNSFQFNENTKNQILDSYVSSFSQKRLMARYPWREPASTSTSVGYHNDFFKPFNGHSQEFDEAIEANNLWENGPVGGEIPPINNTEQFMSDLYETSEGEEMINTGHYSTMKSFAGVNPCNADPNSMQCDSYKSLNRKMGYNYQIQNAVFADNLTPNDLLEVQISLDNIGVAPFYYPWKLQLAILDSNSELLTTIDISDDITTLMPGQTAQLSVISDAFIGMPNDTYQLGFRIVQPGADEAKNEAWKLQARNTYIEFSNDLPVVPSSWDDATNALVGGWSILGEISLTNETLSNNESNLAETVSIYPNPSEDGHFTIETHLINQEPIVVQLYNLLGQEVLNTKQTSSSETKLNIDASNLHSGIYIVKCTQANNRLVKKLKIK